jgi:aubergine-like protein
MLNWAIICTQNNKRYCNDFLEMFKAICQKVKFQIGEPKVIFLRNDSTESYVSEIRNLAKEALNMVVIIFPTIRQDKYSAVKR